MLMNWGATAEVLRTRDSGQTGNSAGAGREEGDPGLSMSTARAAAQAFFDVLGATAHKPLGRHARQPYRNRGHWGT